MNESPIRILAVDDDQELCGLTKEFLETYGYLKVDTAYSVREARAILADRSYDAIVSDYQMPDEDGLFFLRALRAAKDHTPFILFTGKGREEIVIEAYDCGADAYVQKGAETRSIFSDLAHKIREAVAKVRAETALMESEARYRSLIDGSSVGIFLTDMNGGCVYSNHRWLEMTSLTKEGSQGMGWMIGIHPDDLLAFKVNWERSIESGGQHSFEYRYIGPNKRTIWMWGNAAPLKDSGGSITAYMSTNVDITERKRAEEDLLVKERTIAKASSLAKIGYWIWKADQGVITSSDGLSRLLGIPSGTTLPHDHFFEMVHPDDRKVVISALEETLKGKGDLNIEHRMIRSDGSIITVKDTVEVTTGRGNRPVFILGVVQDISELKRVSEVLRDTENLYRIVFETMAEGVIVKDTQGNIVVCNDEAAKILGAPSKEELMVINNVDWRPVNEDGSVSPSNELPFNFTTAVNDSMNNQIKGVRTCSGEMKWLSITTRPLFLARGGDPIGGVVSFVDITEMKMAEIERQQSENKYRMIAENMADVITVFDMALRITYVSPSIFNQRGYRPEDAMSQSLEEILTPTSWELVQRAFAEEIKKEILRDVVQERTIILELEEYRKDGTTIWVSNAVKFVRDQEGHPTSIIVLARDITEKKLADDALREANRKLSLLSSITRYDILNQLHILSGSLSLMDSKSNGNAKAMNRTISVLSNIESLIRFTGEYDQLGSRAPRFIGIRSEVGRIAEEITLTGIKVVNELGGEEVMADPLLNKVFYNLIENTARHGEKATQIIFRSEEAGGVLRIICEDDGVGVPDEYKHIQFEKGKGKNFGLGLFFVKEILSITGITIHEDGRPGKGARFVITVPKGKWRISSS